MDINPIAPDEIEIAPSVMKVGIEEYGLFDAPDPSEWVVPAVYRAMLREAIRLGHVKYVGANAGHACVA